MKWLNQFAEGKEDFTQKRSFFRMRETSGKWHKNVIKKTFGMHGVILQISILADCY